MHHDLFGRKDQAFWRILFCFSVTDVSRLLPQSFHWTFAEETLPGTNSWSRVPVAPWEWRWRATEVWRPCEIEAKWKRRDNTPAFHTAPLKLTWRLRGSSGWGRLSPEEKMLLLRESLSGGKPWHMPSATDWWAGAFPVAKNFLSKWGESFCLVWLLMLSRSRAFLKLTVAREYFERGTWFLPQPHPLCFPSLS